MLWRNDHVTSPRRAIATLLPAAVVLGALTAGGDSASPGRLGTRSPCGASASTDETPAGYSTQDESLVRTMVEGCTEETGSELLFRDANDSELANQSVREGESSPADAFLSENSPSI